MQYNIYILTINYSKKNSIYVTRWFLLGKYVYVSVNDRVPVFHNSSRPSFTQVSSLGVFWPAILEKAWAKIWGNYNSITQIPVIKIFFKINQNNYRAKFL